MSSIDLDLPSRPFACELRIEQSSTIEHGAGDFEEPVNDGAQGASMAVTFGPERLVFGPTGAVETNRALRQVIGGVSQALITGKSAQHHAAIAASSRHCTGSTQGP